jgi:hypothetical protein
MTGEKNRYSSVEKLWKLDDETLKTPRHDEMVIWLLDKNNVKHLLAEKLKDCDINELDIQSEVPIMTDRKFLVGYWDIVVKANKHPFYIEVKPQIDSFGATLRQIKTYQEYELMDHAYLPNREVYEHTYLFTDDLRFKDAFESQGIHVITRQSEEGAR